MFRKAMCALVLTIPLLTAGFGSKVCRSGRSGRRRDRNPLETLTTITFEPSHVRTKEIAEWESLQYGMFIHFGMNTFTQVEESALGDVPPTTYAPTELDVDQWVRVAKEAGMKIRRTDGRAHVRVLSVGQQGAVARQGIRLRRRVQFQQNRRRGRVS